MKNDASEIRNLSQKEAIKKLKELARHQSVCLFTTKLTQIPLTPRPMSVQHVDDHGTFWFLSPDGSNKNKDIADDSRVQLFFSNTSNFEFLSVYGHASISRDKKKINELWSNIAKAWFTEGKDDPRITVIKFVPDQGFYWDTKDGKIVSLIKIVSSAVTGKTYEEGIEGTIDLK